MSEAWLDEYEKLKALCDDLQRDINERNRLITAGLGASRENAQLRKSHGVLEHGTKTLSEALNKAIASPQALKAFGVTEKEIGRRRDLITSLNVRKDQLSNAIKGGVTGTGERTELLAAGGGGAKGVKTYSTTLENDRTRHLENEQVLAMQSNTMKAQDEQLGEISKSLSRVKEISLDINEELDLHKRLLSDIESGTERTGAKLGREQKRLTKLTKAQTGCCVFVVLFLLIGILVALALTQWGCKIVYSNSYCEKKK